MTHLIQALLYFDIFRNPVGYFEWPHLGNKLLLTVINETSSKKTCSSQQPAQWHAGEHSGCWWCTTGNHLVACRPSDDIALGLNISGIDNWRCHGRNDISRDRGNITCGNYKEDFIWIDKQNQQRNSFIGLSIYNLSWSTKYIDSVTIVPHAWHEHNIYNLQCSHW